MARYTQTQLDALRAAIAAGVTEVTVGGKSVKYRSLAAMESLAQSMEDDINTAAGVTPVRQVRIRTGKGTG